MLNGDAVDDALAEKAMKLEPTAVHHNDDVWALGGTSLREAGGRVVKCRRWRHGRLGAG